MLSCTGTITSFQPVFLTQLIPNTTIYTNILTLILELIEERKKGAIINLFFL